MRLARGHEMKLLRITYTLTAAVLSWTLLLTPAHIRADETVRDKVRAGALRPCVAETVTDRESQPVITLQNRCARQVNVMLCVNVPGRPVAHYLLLINAGSKAQHRIWIDDGEPFRYNYNSCDRPYCTPPRSEC